MAMVLLGLGTALVYPTLIAAISDIAHPEWRASAVGVYRLWRDAGYVAGALLAGAVADLFGLSWAIAAVGLLTFISGLIVLVRMYETLAGVNPLDQRSRDADRSRRAGESSCGAQGSGPRPADVNGAGGPGGNPWH
jgi:MFS family permease